jgi:hypothetical protein
MNTTVVVKSVVMELTKSTAGTHVYQEPNKPGKTFPTVYIQKSALSDPPPQRVKVTVEPL